MATINATIKKAEKLTGQKIQKNSNNQFWVEHKGYTVSFYPNGRMENGEVEATNFYTMKKGDKNDSMSDSFPGCFHDNFTQAFRFLERYK